MALLFLFANPFSPCGEPLFIKYLARVRMSFSRKLLLINVIHACLEPIEGWFGGWRQSEMQRQQTKEKHKKQDKTEHTKYNKKQSKENRTNRTQDTKQNTARNKAKKTDWAKVVGFKGSSRLLEAFHFSTHWDPSPGTFNCWTNSHAFESSGSPLVKQAQNTKGNQTKQRETEENTKKRHK